MTRPATSGGFANDAGSILERMVRQVRAGKGFMVVRHAEYQRHPDQYSSELLLEQVPYQTIYGHPEKTEFLLRSASCALEMRIECK